MEDTPTETASGTAEPTAATTVESDPFAVPVDVSVVGNVHTGSRVRALVGGRGVAWLQHGIDRPFFTAVALEDETDIGGDGRLGVGPYSQRGV